MSRLYFLSLFLLALAFPAWAADLVAAESSAGPAVGANPLAHALLERNQAEAVRLIRAGQPLDLRLDAGLVDDLLPRRARMNHDPGGYPLAIAAAVLGLPGVLAAIGEREPARLHVADGDNKTAINYAAQQGYAGCVAVLLRHGLNPLQPPRKAWASGTPLSRAVMGGHAAAVKLLLDAIPRAQYASDRVTEQVWSATFPQLQDHPDVLQILLAAGVSPNYIAPQGGTALINAIENQNPAQVRLLIQYGAKAFAHPYRGRNAHEWALYYNSPDAKAAAREIAGLVGALKVEASSWQKSREVEQFEQTLRYIGAAGKATEP